MKRIALAAVGAAAVTGLTACSHTATSSTAPASSQPVISSTSAAECIQQYKTWKDGHGKGVVAALSTVSSADKAGDTQMLSIALKKAKPAIARAARYPIPACADPKGYLGVLLMHVNAAESVNSVSSLRAAMAGVPEIERKLTAELNRIVT
jgi:hypothetical protein